MGFDRVTDMGTRFFEIELVHGVDQKRQMEMKGDQIGKRKGKSW